MTWSPDAESAVAIRPMGDHVVIRPAEVNRAMHGSLFVPHSIEGKPRAGIVLAVGPGRTAEGQRVPMELEVGNEVLYIERASAEFIDGGQKYVIVRESDVLVVTR